MYVNNHTSYTLNTLLYAVYLLQAEQFRNLGGTETSKTLFLVDWNSIQMFGTIHGIIKGSNYFWKLTW